MHLLEAHIEYAPRLFNYWRRIFNMRLAYELTGGAFLTVRLAYIMRGAYV